LRTPGWKRSTWPTATAQLPRARRVEDRVGILEARGQRLLDQRGGSRAGAAGSRRARGAPSGTAMLTASRLGEVVDALEGRAARFRRHRARPRGRPCRRRHEAAACVLGVDLRVEPSEVAGSDHRDAQAPVRSGRGAKGGPQARAHPAAFSPTTPLDAGAAELLPQALAVAALRALLRVREARDEVDRAAASRSSARGGPRACCGADRSSARSAGRRRAGTRSPARRIRRAGARSR
jgi:hypothetical protein